jgi:hypothetical protein
MLKESPQPAPINVRFGERYGSGDARSGGLRHGDRVVAEPTELDERCYVGLLTDCVLSSHRGRQGFKSPQLQAPSALGLEHLRSKATTWQHEVRCAALSELPVKSESGALGVKRPAKQQFRRRIDLATSAQVAACSRGGPRPSRHGLILAVQPPDVHHPQAGGLLRWRGRGAGGSYHVRSAVVTESCDIVLRSGIITLRQ